MRAETMSDTPLSAIAECCTLFKQTNTHHNHWCDKATHAPDCDVAMYGTLHKCDCGFGDRKKRDRLEWLADKIPALGDYAKEAATYLREFASTLPSQSRPMNTAPTDEELKTALVNYEAAVYEVEEGNIDTRREELLAVLRRCKEVRDERTPPSTRAIKLPVEARFQGHITDADGVIIATCRNGDIANEIVSALSAKETKHPSKRV